MKHVKKIFAFALTLVMALAVALPAYAADGDLTVDDKVSVSGFEADDSITAYQFITWVDGEGWKLAEGITGITLADITNGLDASELATLASAANVAKMTPVTGKKTGTTWEYTCGTAATAGSYLILVTSNTVNYIYNPVVVSADFDGTNDNAVDLTSQDANLKKEEVKIEKVADNASDDYDVQVGDIIPFTVKVTVPQYSANWTDPYFVVTDQLSAGLTIEVPPTIAGLTEGTHYTLTNGKKGDRGFTIKFTDSYLKGNASAALEIKYSAIVGNAAAATTQVHEETNTATLEFSNDPSNSSLHNTDSDETHHYTFAIGADRLGQGTGKTIELIKVGVDESTGTPITSIVEGEEFPTGVTALAGAEFKLTGTGPNNAGKYEQTAKTDANGRLSFNNLEVGAYKLQETNAPDGYIKDTTVHDVVISASYNDDKTLASYTITIDGKVSSTYTATTNAENATVCEASTGNASAAINNKQGTELPSTGGIGTTIFYVVGGVMVAGAVVFLLTKRRMASAE